MICLLTFNVPILWLVSSIKKWLYFELSPRFTWNNTRLTVVNWHTLQHPLSYKKSCSLLSMSIYLRPFVFTNYYLHTLLSSASIILYTPNTIAATKPQLIVLITIVKLFFSRNALSNFRISLRHLDLWLFCGQIESEIDTKNYTTLCMHCTKE